MYDFWDVVKYNDNILYSQYNVNLCQHHTIKRFINDTLFNRPLPVKRNSCLIRVFITFHLLQGIQEGCRKVWFNTIHTFPRRYNSTGEIEHQLEALRYSANSSVNNGNSKSGFAERFTDR